MVIPNFTTHEIAWPHKELIKAYFHQLFRIMNATGKTVETESEIISRAYLKPICWWNNHHTAKSENL